MMSWEIIHNGAGTEWVLVEYRDIYDGGLFWYNEETRECHKRWNDQFYKDRCLNIDEIMKSFATNQNKEEK